MAADSSAARQNVTFASNGDQAHGYLATPASGSGPGVLVIQEWWGLTSHIASLVDRFAAEGFVALAPDLYGGTTTHDADEAGQMMSALPPDRAARDLAGAVDYLVDRDDVDGDQIGVVGFCMGGAFVLTLAVQQGDRVAAAVPFYPVGAMPEDYRGLTAEVLAHYGEDDAFVPVATADELAAQIKAQSGVGVTVHKYPAGHAFNNDDNLLGTYDPDQAKLAWDRTVAFLHQRLS